MPVWCEFDAMSECILMFCPESDLVRGWAGLRRLMTANFSELSVLAANASVSLLVVRGLADRI